MLLIAASTVMPCNDAYAGPKRPNSRTSTAKAKAKAKAKIKIKVKGSNKEGKRVGYRTVPPPNGIAVHRDSLQRELLSRPGRHNMKTPSLLDQSRLYELSRETLGERSVSASAEGISRVLQYDKATMDKLARNEFDFGMNCYNHQLYERAFREFERAAKYGDSKAEYMLGRMYYEGNGTEQSYEKAYNHYVAAAEKGLQNAHYELGWMHYSGRGCKKSYESALEHFIKAAERGHKYAQYYAARMFCDGKGTPESREDAIKWFTKAAAQGLEEAKASIGYCVEGN